jgi:hypothetical protein
MHSTQITLFLESVFTNEALHHEIEHRIFELEPWKSMENNPEIEIEAFAYSTGILFRIRSFHLQIQDVINAFGELRNTKIPSFSHEEKRRFLREIEEREVDRREDFDSWAGEEFLKEFEDVPKIPEVTSFCDVFSRMSMVISDSEGWRYEEQKFLNTREVPALPLAKVSSKINDSYHLYHLYPTQNARELVTATIAANATREMLRKIFRTK